MADFVAVIYDYPTEWRVEADTFADAARIVSARVLEDDEAILELRRADYRDADYRTDAPLLTAPLTDRAFAENERCAPDDLNGVEVTLALLLEACELDDGSGRWIAAEPASGHTHGPLHRTLGDCEAWIERQSPERSVVYWVGLDRSGAVNVTAARERAEQDNDGWTAQDWGAA